MLKDGKQTINLFIKRMSNILPEWRNVGVIRVFGAIEPYIYTPAVNNDELPDVFQQEFRKNASIAERSIFILTNVKSTSDCIVFKNFKIFIPSLAAAWIKNYLDYSFLLKQWYGNHISLPGTEDGVALIYDQWSGNYYHWLIDTLPRLLILREKFPDYLLLMPKSGAPFMKATANILGFKNYLDIEKNQILDAHKIIIPGQAAHTLFHDPVLIQRVQKELLDGLGYIKKKPHRRIYISRSTQRKRRVANELDVRDLVKKYNFEIIHFENMTFEDQAALMQEAEVVIGVHGANMANILFMQPKCAVVEMLNANAVNPLYFRLSSYLNLAYYALPCDPIIPETLSENLGPVLKINDNDILVDLENLENMILKIISKSVTG